jgi:hypothetical protein
MEVHFSDTYQTASVAGPKLLIPLILANYCFKDGDFNASLIMIA